MRKNETTEQAVHRLVKKCGKAFNALYTSIPGKEERAELDKISRAVSDLATIAMAAERRGK